MHCDPERSRTLNLRSRNPLLYPVELLSQVDAKIDIFNNKIQIE